MKYLSTYSSQTPACLSQSLVFVLDWKTFFGEDTTGFTVKSFVLYREGQEVSVQIRIYFLIRTLLKCPNLSLVKKLRLGSLFDNPIPQRMPLTIKINPNLYDRQPTKSEAAPG